MKLISLKEQEDGSAIIEMDMTPDEIQLVIEVGFTKMLKDGMEKFENVLKSGPDNESE